MIPTELASLLHLTAVLVLTGFVWTAQLILYPALFDIEPSRWNAFHRRGARNVTLIVLPAMAVQLMTSILLVWENPQPLHHGFLFAAITAWIVTVAVFIPLHGKLGLRPLPALIRQLIALNWIRTLIWTGTAIAAVASSASA